MDAATVAFAAKGYAATSVTGDVLQPAGISVGSFYHQLPDKAALFAAVVEEAAAAAQLVMDGLQAARGPELQEGATDSWRLILSMVDRFEPLFRIHMRERANPDPEVAVPLASVKATWARGITLRHGRTETLPADYPTAAAVSLLGALGLGVMQTYLDLDPAEREGRRDELAEHLGRFTVGGLRALAPSEGRDDPDQAR